MNQEFYEYALNIVENLTDDEIEAGLRKHNITFERKNMLETKEAAPVRHRVEVLVKRDDLYLLIYSVDPGENPDWRALPGGGVDDMTHEEACITECLEEVGIKIKNVRTTHLSLAESHVSGKGDRRDKFSGSHTTWYLADFDCADVSKLGADGDIRHCEWVTYETAHARLYKSGGPRVQYQRIALDISQAT